MNATLIRINMAGLSDSRQRVVAVPGTEPHPGAPDDGAGREVTPKAETPRQPVHRVSNREVNEVRGDITAGATDQSNEALMSGQCDAAFIAKRLEKAQRHGDGWRCRCPAHYDADPSFDIKDGDKGPIFQCRAGCSQTAIISALTAKGLWLPVEGDKKKSRSKPSSSPEHKPKAEPRRHPVAYYPYIDPAAELRYQVVRYEPKDFRPRRPDGKGGWIYNLDGVTPLPYRLPELFKAIDRGDRVFIVEGEKDVDNLAEIGITASCNAGGAGKFNAALVDHFRGAKVTIIPDNDRAGGNHCTVVAAALQGTVASIDVLELPDLPEKGDVSDWLATGGSAEQLRALKTCPFNEWLVAQPVVAETDDELLARLAALSTLQYNRVRKAEAAAAGVQPRALDAAVKKHRGEITTDTDDPPDFLVDPEPWSEPVDGAELLNGIADAVNAHMVLPKGAAWAIALWVVHCHAHDLFPISQLIEEYGRLGLKFVAADDAVEAGIEAVSQRLACGRLKVFRTLSTWLSEFRRYRRNDKGQENTLLMDCTRHLVLTGMKHADIDHGPYDED